MRAQVGNGSFLSAAGREALLTNEGGAAGARATRMSDGAMRVTVWSLSGRSIDAVPVDLPGVFAKFAKKYEALDPTLRLSQAKESAQSFHSCVVRMNENCMVEPEDRSDSFELEVDDRNHCASYFLTRAICAVAVGGATLLGWFAVTQEEGEEVGSAFKAAAAVAGGLVAGCCVAAWACCGLSAWADARVARAEALEYPEPALTVLSEVEQAELKAALKPATALLDAAGADVVLGRGDHVRILRMNDEGDLRSLNEQNPKASRPASLREHLGYMCVALEQRQHLTATVDMPALAARSAGF